MTRGALTGWFIKIIFILERTWLLYCSSQFTFVRCILHHEICAENRLRLKWLLITTEARFFNESLQLKNNLFTVARQGDDCTNKAEHVSERHADKFIVKMCRNVLCSVPTSKHAGRSESAPSRYCSVPRWLRGRSFTRSRSGWGCRGPRQDAAGAQRWGGTVCRASSGVRWMFTFWNRNTASSDAFGENKTGT